MIQQQKENERQMNRQREITAKLERTIEKLNKQITEIKYQQLQRQRYISEQGKSSKSNSLSSLHKKHHVIQGQDHSSPNSNHRRPTNNQSGNDDQDVIFF